ncbi:V-type ATP synthase subunit C [Thermococcus sp.]|uniref:V-type ATP synthase subunit C n=1 Tax=Thermococcus sp. TaxID=35749 RepID=UPI0026275F80|nr:V-type ATP synthase subunit C [Thermococcus sp.]
MLSDTTLTAILDTTLGVVFTWLGWKTYKILWKYTPYSYPNARINAMEAKLLSEQRLGELAESRTLQNLIVNLEDTDYKNFMGSATTVDELERALERSLASTYLLMEDILPDRVSGFFRLLLEEWDVRNIASVVKAKKRGEPAVDYVLEIGTIVPRVRAMAEAKTMEEILVILEGTPYEEPYQKLLLDEISLTDFETWLYRIYYSKLLDYALSRKDEEERLILGEFVRTKIDITNIITLLRGKAAGLPGEEIRKSLVPGGTLKLDSALNVEDLGMALAELDSTKYGPVIRSVREEAEKDVSAVRDALEDYLLQRVGELTKFYPLSIATALSYILRKEREMRRLRALIRLVASGFSPERIKAIIGGGLAP